MLQQSIPRVIYSVSLILVFTFFFLLLEATNPVISNQVINLSEGLNQYGIQDLSPEMIIDGNTIHVIWIQYRTKIFYTRSLDLGKTWEEPKLIHETEGLAYQTDSRRLAVDNGVVHIACSFSNSSSILYFQSSDNGETFNEPIELADFYWTAVNRIFINAKNGNVAVAAGTTSNWTGGGNSIGYLFYSPTNVDTFQTKTIYNYQRGDYTLGDFLWEGDLMVIPHSYSYYRASYDYGGEVHVAVSTNTGDIFTLNKILKESGNDYDIIDYDINYVPKVAYNGASNIYLVFENWSPEKAHQPYVARSTDKGQTFENAINFNIEGVPAGEIQHSQENIIAKGNYVYISFLRTNSQVYMVRSDNGGATYSAPFKPFPEIPDYIKATWWPKLLLDKTDETGASFYVYGNSSLNTHSSDGGISFSNYSFFAPLFHVYFDASEMIQDDNGDIHFITTGSFSPNIYITDRDVLYQKVTKQPEPGTVNKSYKVSSVINGIAETTLIPSSESIDFDSVMTAEAWVKLHKWETWDWATGYISIIAKVNGADGGDASPSGYNMGFRFENGKYIINSGLQTDKGPFINWSGHAIEDTLWHHIAFTYDANAGLNNFKTFVDGLLKVEQTVTGKITQGNGLLMLGSRSSFKNNTRFNMDEIRLWDRALSQKELLENQQKAFTGNEDGLKLYLNFDDTFKDISGNGNDAIPLYLSELDTSNFDPPIPDFETYQTLNEVSFNNKTQNASSYKWDFGDGNSSVQGNPKNVFSTPGEYYISLTATNKNSVTSNSNFVTIVGLDRVEPAKGSNIGESLLSIYGGGLNSDMNILLRYEDNTEIVADTIVDSGEDGVLQALFALSGAKTGLWDVVVVGQGNEIILPKSFTITQAEGVAEPWINVSGRNTVMLNRWNKFIVNYGNNGDVDALMVPVSFAVPDVDGLEVDYIDFKFVLPDEVFEYNLVEELSPYKDFFITESLFGKQQRSKVYSLMIPRIKANSSESLHIIIKSPVSFTLTSWTGDGWLQYTDGAENSIKKASLNQQLNSCIKTGVNDFQSGADKAPGLCIIEALGVTTIETSISVIPAVGAIYNSFKSGYTVAQFDRKDGVKSVRNTALQGATTFFSYTAAVPIVGWVASTIGGLVCGGISAYYAVSDCLSQPGNEKGVTTISSLDPNEMIGPDGFSEKGWIAKINTIPYTILFENKSEATAPAHDVFITDTLDLSKFDISNFGFSSFGWGDTILSPPGNELKEFSMDVDLRPNINLITRVSAKLDTLTGVVRWEFLSLNPETMNLEEDPFIGFLPPNVSSPEGEGFVSFSVGLKEELGTNDEIRNQASIVFDANEPILTNEYLNTLDLDAPQSQVYPLEATIDSRFPVDWTGTDEGSGIGSYTIYVMENDTLLYPWLINTPEITAEFIGEVGSTYKFYSIATDNVGHKESTPDGYDAWTTVTVDVEEFERVKEELAVWPNPVKDNLRVTFSHAPCGMYVVELVSATGSVKHSQLYEDRELQNGISVNVSDYSPGQYVLRVIFANKTETRKVVVQ